MPLRTARLVLRLPEPREAPLLVDFVARNETHLARWEPERPVGYFTEPFWRERLERLRVEEREGRQKRVYLFPRDATKPRVVGSVALNDVVRGAFQCARFGFALDTELEGRGLMREALEAMIADAFGPLALHRIEANHEPDNLRSAGLLRRLGFEPYGYSRDYLHLGGQWRDSVHTALVNRAWSQRRAT